MRSHSLLPLVVLAWALGVGSSWAEETPTFNKHIRPILIRYCLECHEKEPEGGLYLGNYDGLMKGGEHGPAIKPGKPDDSRMILMMEGKVKPVMPPRRSQQPNRKEIELLRQWVKAGARKDGAVMSTVLPTLRPRSHQSAPVHALAYHAKGHLLAVGLQNEVQLLSAPAGERLARFPWDGRRIKALAFHPSVNLLAVAGGQESVAGEIQLFRQVEGKWQAGKTLTGHTDVPFALQFSPDGRLLASAGYDRSVHVWDIEKAQLLRQLKDHSDAVYGLSFHPEGSLLATAGADRAVKVWDVATGQRLYTLGESTDWVYAVAWSPSGKHLAAAGVDRSIRVWTVNREGGQIAQSAFAHEAPVLRLQYSDDGTGLFSLGQEGRVKEWDVANLAEKKAFPFPGETVLTFALSPRGQQLAVGTYEGTLALVEGKTGKIQSRPLPVKPEPPALKKLSTTSLARGQKTVLTATVTGSRPMRLLCDLPGVRIVDLGENSAGALRFEVTFPANTPVGAQSLKLTNDAGTSAPIPVQVTLFAPVDETEPNQSASSGQTITLPASLRGGLHQAGEVDFFTFSASKDQEIGVQVQPAGGLLPALSLIDDQGKVVETGETFLGHRVARTGQYALGIRDREYRGNKDMTYRVDVGAVPVVTGFYPPGVQRGTETEVRIEGVHLGGLTSVRIKVPAEAALGSRIPVPVTTALGTPMGSPTVVVGEFPDRWTVGEQTSPLEVDSTANGRLLAPGAEHRWKFQAKKGEVLMIEVEARRLGSPLDSLIEILDARGRPVPQAILRSVARTYSTFRDHDSVSPGVRLETWSELAVNDYLYSGNSLIRIRALPKNPDDDCQFFSDDGQRKGYLGTTPQQIAQGTPMYKVTVHPPGTEFPPNGLPLVTLFARNDDGGARWGKDSLLTFLAPEDAEYQVRLMDARGEGSPRHFYRLTVRRPRPDFTISFSPSAPAVWEGGALPITVNVDRLDGFDKEIFVELQNLPAGLSAPKTSILPGERSTVFALFAEPGTKMGPQVGNLKLLGRAQLGARELVREAAGGKPTVVPAGDLLTTTEQSEVQLRPGGTTRLTVKIERRNGFNGRVPLDVLGLPHGVRVLDIGLNGILVVPEEKSRTVELFCEPWVQPTAHPFVVLSRREGRNSEHAARSVLLQIRP